MNAADPDVALPQGPCWTHLQWPLNVYGELLQLEEGRVDAIHYGLFADATEPIHAAQERARQRLLSQLPSPRRALVVGARLGTTLSSLLHLGFAAQGLPTQDMPAQDMPTQGMPAQHRPTQDRSVQEQVPFELMVLRESAQAIDPLALFLAAHDRLVQQDAQLLVMDEFALYRDSGNDATLHLLPDFLALSARFGWRVEVNEDLSASAAHTLTVLQRLCARWGEQVMQTLAVPLPQWQALQASLASYAQAYASGRFGYRLLRLHRAQRPPTRLLPLQPQGQAMRALFAQVFKHDMTLPTWHWKYRPGHAHALAFARDDGSISAHYAGFARPLRVCGEPMMGCQVGDVMVSPQADGSLAHHRALRQVSTTFLERHIGWGRAHAIGFGFPNDRHMAVAKHLGVYEAVDRVLQLRWAGVQGTTTRWHCEALPADGTPWPPGLKLELAQLWQAMACALPQAVLGVRDPDWLHWRYTQRPDVRYGLTLVRSPHLRRAVGLAVTRQHEDALELLDLVAAPRRFGVVVSAVLAQAAAAGQPVVRAWITASHQHLLAHVAPTQLSVEDPHITVPANCHTAGPPASLVRDRWFLMSGDADFT